MKQLFLAALLFALPLHAQSTYSVTMTYDREGLTVPHWKIMIPEQGDAQYTGKPTKGVDPGLLTFRMSSSGHEKLGWLLSQSNNLHPCETKSKGIANMGQKDLTYWPSGASEVHCSFNYTDNKALAQSTDYLMALANTIQTGVELDRLHRYDRLGLDAVMHRLVADVKENRAVEIVAIRPTLQRLVDDEALMDRVRANAQNLLTLASQEAVK